MIHLDKGEFEGQRLLSAPITRRSASLRRVACQFGYRRCGRVARRRQVAEAVGSSSHLTPRWRRQSRANPSLNAEFPASREFTGNFIDSGPHGASTAAKKGIKSERYEPIPYASEQGIFCGLAGNLNRRSGKFPPRSGNPALVRYLGPTGPTNPILPRDLERCREAKRDAARCSRSRGPRYAENRSPSHATPGSPFPGCAGAVWVRSRAGRHPACANWGHAAKVNCYQGNSLLDNDEGKLI